MALTGGAFLFAANLTGALGNSLVAESFAPSNNIVEVRQWAPIGITFITDSTNEPTYNGMPISRWIETNTTIDPRQLGLKELLTIKQDPKTDKWGVVKFELPIFYDTVRTHVGAGLDLGWFDKDGNFVQCGLSDFERAKDGHCRLWWTTSYDSPGTYQIRARLSWYDNANSIDIIGPPLSFESSNVCRFFEGYSLFDSTGALLQARLREPIAKYQIELTTQRGKHLKTFTGSTTNGVINLEWDLKDDHDKIFKGDSFEGAFYVIYPDDSHTNEPARDTFNRIPDPSN